MRVFSQCHSELCAEVKLIEGAQKTWRRLDGHDQLPKVFLGVRFSDRLEVKTATHQPKAAA